MSKLYAGAHHVKVYYIHIGTSVWEQKHEELVENQLMSCNMLTQI